MGEVPMFKDVRMSELYCWKKSRTQRVKSWEVGKISSILLCLEDDNKIIEIEFVNLDLDYSVRVSPM